MEQLRTNRSSRDSWCLLVAFSKLPGAFRLISWTVLSPVTEYYMAETLRPNILQSHIACILCLYCFMLGATMLKAMPSACFSCSSHVHRPGVPKSRQAAEEAKRQSLSFCAEVAQRLARLFLAPDSGHNHLQSK